jgi:hypothetical protein
LPGGVPTIDAEASQVLETLQGGIGIRWMCRTVRCRIAGQQWGKKDRDSNRGAEQYRLAGSP